MKTEDLKEEGKRDKEEIREGFPITKTESSQVDL